MSLVRWASPPDSVPAGRSRDRYPRPMSVKASRVSRSPPSSGATVGSSSARTHSARSLICIWHSSAMFLPATREDRAVSLSRVPPQSGQEVKVTARSTKARMCGCMASTSLLRNVFWICGMIPRKVRLMPSTLILVASWCSRARSSRSEKSRIGVSQSNRPQPRRIRPCQPSIDQPGMVSAPSLMVLVSS